MKIRALRSAFCIVSMFVGSGILLTGCGTTSTTPPNNTQPASPAPSASTAPGAGSGGSAGSGGGSSTGSGGSSGSTTGGGDSATSISGTIVNSQTGAPVNGIVAVGLEGADSDFTIRAQTTADAEGHFRFDNVQPAPNGFGWAIGVAARSSDGTLFAPTLLISHNGGTGDAIVPGTDVGTITLMPSPKGTLQGNVFSQDSAGLPQSVNVIIDPLNTFVMDRHFQVPWIDGAPKLTTHDADPACSTQSGGACAVYTLTVPTANVWMATYDHTGNQFRSSSTLQDYSAFFSATSAAGAPDCNPSSVEEFFGGFGGSTEIVPNSQPHFQACTP